MVQYLLLPKIVKMPRSFIFILFLAAGNAFSQNEIPSTLFWNNYMHFNPAMTGLQYKQAANVQWRNQWTSVNGAPTVLWANYAQKIDKIHGAAGISYEYETIGFNQQHTALATYAFHLPVKNMVLSFGTSLGALTMLNNGNFVYPNNPNDPSLPKYRDSRFQVDLGAALHHEKWNIGISITQLNNSSILNNSDGYSANGHFNADYTLDLNPSWRLTPALHIYTDWVKSASHSSLMARRNNLWFGFNIQNIILGDRSYGGMLGYDFKEKFRVGYSLEYVDLQIYENTPNLTHEVVVSFLLK